MKKYNNGGGLRQALTGIDIDGGGFDTFKDNPIASMIPGGGLLASAAGVAGGLLDRRAAQRDISRGRKDAQKARKQIQRSRAELDAFDFDVSQAQRDLATAGIRPTDLSPMQGMQATELAALSTDPRALMGGIGASTARAQQATLAAQQADLGRELTAMRGLANLEQTALERKQGLKLGLLEEDRAMALADRATARQNIEAARQAKRAAGAQIASSAIGGLTGLASLLPENEKGGRVKYGNGGKMNEDVLIAILEEGGKNDPVTKLEGEFDHDTNKKAIIDEETGVKEAEATGGEYILNPEQGEEINMAYKGIEQIVDSGEEPTMDQLMALYEAVRNVFSQPQFNEA